MNEEKRFCIRILSPIHVGCDEVYEPTGFVIDENTCSLNAFDPLDFLRSLGQQDKDRLASICGKGTAESIMELYKFMRGKRFVGHSVSVCAGFLENYRKTLSISDHDQKKIQQELNNFSISRTAFNPTTQQPYIPGSAVKGVLRTAYLNGRQAVKKLPQARNANQLERDLLDGGSFASDPFRLLKVSDFHPVGLCVTKIVYAVNEKKKPSKFQARGPYQILEVIEPGAVFMGAIQILPPLTRDAIKTPLTEKTLFQSADEFYRKEKAREDRELKEIEVSGLEIVERTGDIPIRIGRHSGAESLTIEGQRNIRIMKKRGERQDYSDKATTFWLAAESPTGYQKGALKPFGWAALGELTAEMYAAYEKISEEDRRSRAASSSVVTAHTADGTKIAPQADTAKTPIIVRNPLEKLLDELKIVSGTDMGRIGTIIQKLDTLENDTDKAIAAIAIRDKIGVKAFKKHKRKDDLESLIRRATF